MSIRDAGTTIRPSSTASLTIDSEDRFASYVEKRKALADPKSYNYSPYNFSLIKNGVLVNGYMTRLAVSEVVFPWVIPNISNTTQVLKYRSQIGVGAVNIGTILVDVGFYTPKQLAAKITSLIAAIDPSFVMNYAPSGAGFSVGPLPIFVYEVDPQNTIHFAPLVKGQTYGTPAEIWSYPDTTKQLFDLLGFTDRNTFGGSLVPNAGSGQATFAQGTRYVDIVCPLLTANQGLPDATSQTISDSALCRIYLGDAVNYSSSDVAADTFAPPGTEPTIIYRAFPSPKQIAWNAIQPVQGRLQFQVLDDNGQVLSPDFWTVFPPPFEQLFDPYISSSDWSLTLLLSEN
jgi:hypothetical protein